MKTLRYSTERHDQYHKLIAILYLVDLVDYLILKLILVIIFTKNNQISGQSDTLDIRLFA
jgi:4-diphosphocytidyl-2C-methyl-D-erythritol kinase